MGVVANGGVPYDADFWSLSTHSRVDVFFLTPSLYPMGRGMELVVSMCRHRDNNYAWLSLAIATAGPVTQLFGFVSLPYAASLLCPASIDDLRKQLEKPFVRLQISNADQEVEWGL